MKRLGRLIRAWPEPKPSTVRIKVRGAVDSQAVGKQIVELLQKQARATGRKPEPPEDYSI